MSRRTRIVAVAALILAAVSCSVRAGEAQRIEFADLASGKVQIVGRLGVPIGQVVRVEATIVSADKVWPDSKIFQDSYLLSIHSIDGRPVKDLETTFQVHNWAEKHLFRSGSDLKDELRSGFKREPTAAEIAKLESKVLSGRKRTFLVYEVVALDGVPENMSSEVIPWAGTSFGPFSHVRVIHEPAASSSFEKEHSVLFKFAIKSLDLSPNGEFRLLTLGDASNDNFGIILRMPPRDVVRWPLDSESYQFPVLIEAVDDKTREGMDALLTRKFGEGKPQTVFKPGGYSAASSRTPAELGKSGGHFSLVDPGVGSGRSWAINVNLDLEEKSLTLEVSSMRF